MVSELGVSCRFGSGYGQWVAEGLLSAVVGGLRVEASRFKGAGPGWHVMMLLYDFGISCLMVLGP